MVGVNRNISRHANIIDGFLGNHRHGSVRRTTMRKYQIIAALAALLIGACSGTPPPSTSTPPAEIDQALLLWQAADISSYEIVYIWHCECDPGWAGPWRVTVSDESITKFAHDQGMEALDDPPQLTIEDLFAKARAAITDFPGNHAIEYDPDFGFPRSIAADLEAIAVDGGEYMAVWEFTPTN